MSASLVSQAKLRAGLVRQATSICASLCDILGNIEPSRFIKPSSDMECELVVALDELYQLEDTLHRQLQQLHERRNDALTAVSRLPDDILRYIFKFNCVPPPDREITGPMWSISPIRLSHVCRRWRYLSVDAANLWACASFCPRYLDVGPDVRPSLRKPSQGGQSRLVLDDKHSVFLSRSRASPLTIELRVGHYVGSDSRSLRHTMVPDFVDQCSGRIHHLSAEFNSETEGCVTRCLSSNRKALQKLVLSNVGYEPISSDTTMRHLLMSHMPQLRDVALRRIPLPTSYEDYFVGLAFCRTLELVATAESHFSPDSLRMLLCSCPELRQLSLSLHASLVVSVGRGDIPCAEKLEAFIVRCPRSLLSAFTAFRAPRLNRLALTLDGDDADSGESDDVEEQLAHYARAVQVFLRASSPPLQSFEAPDLSPQHLIRILTSMPTLRELSVDHVYGDGDDAFELLTTMSTPFVCKEGAICPGLERLQVKFPADSYVLESLLQFTRARRKGTIRTTPIRRLSLTDPQQSRSDQEVQHNLYTKLAAEVEDLILGHWKFDQTIQDWVRWDEMDD